MNITTNIARAYDRSLREIHRLEPRSRLLERFWTFRPNWPQGNDSKIFIGDAVDAIGRARFSDDWTGSEFGAQESIGAFPTFEGTLNYHFNGPGRIRSSLSLKPSSLAVAEYRSAKVPSIEPAEAFGSQREQMGSELAKLVQEWAALRPQYDTFAAAWDRHKEQDRAARDRLQWVTEWIARKGRDGDLSTYLRAVDTIDQTVEYIEVHPGFWEVRNVLEHRLKRGTLSFRLPDTSSIKNRNKPAQYFIFLSRTEIQSEARMFSPDLTQSSADEYNSEWMLLLRLAVNNFGITRSNQPKLVELEEWFKKQYVDHELVSSNMAGYLARVVRTLESGKGRGRKPVDKK